MFSLYSDYFNANYVFFVWYVLCDASWVYDDFAGIGGGVDKAGDAVVFVGYGYVWDIQAVDGGAEADDVSVLDFALGYFVFG